MHGEARGVLLRFLLQCGRLPHVIEKQPGLGGSSALMVIGVFYKAITAKLY